VFYSQICIQSIQKIPFVLHPTAAGQFFVITHLISALKTRDIRILWVACRIALFATSFLQATTRLAPYFANKKRLS
jgi:hypothetical protein